MTSLKSRSFFRLSTRSRSRSRSRFRSRSLLDDDVVCCWTIWSDASCFDAFFWSIFLWTCSNCDNSRCVKISNAYFRRFLFKASENLFFDRQTAEFWIKSSELTLIFEESSFSIFEKSSSLIAEKSFAFWFSRLIVNAFLKNLQCEWTSFNEITFDDVKSRFWIMCLHDKSDLLLYDFVQADKTVYVFVIVLYSWFIFLNAKKMTNSQRSRKTDCRNFCENFILISSKAIK